MSGCWHDCSTTIHVGHLGEVFQTQRWPLRPLVCVCERVGGKQMEDLFPSLIQRSK